MFDLVFVAIFRSLISPRKYVVYPISVWTDITIVLGTAVRDTMLRREKKL